jgi:hypothetical protein
MGRISFFSMLMIRRSTGFYGTAGPIWRSPEPTTCPYPAPSQSNPRCHPIPWRPTQYYPPIHANVFKIVCIWQVSTLKPCRHFCLPVYVPHAPPHLFSICWRRIQAMQFFFPIPVISSLLGLSVFLSLRFWKTLSLCFCLYVRPSFISIQNNQGTVMYIDIHRLQSRRPSNSIF